MSLAVKWLELTADHSSAVKQYFHSPICLHGMHKDKFTFTFTKLSNAAYHVTFKSQIQKI
jgi:hypothetical protein